MYSKSQQQSDYFSRRINYSLNRKTAIFLLISTFQHAQVNIQHVFLPSPSLAAACHFIKLNCSLCYQSKWSH